MIKWDNLQREDVEAIGRICKRVYKTFPDIDYLTLNMDITAVHVETPLNLSKFESFRRLDFFHDVFGITRHLNRATGKLNDCFVPRCSAQWIVQIGSLESAKY